MLNIKDFNVEYLRNKDSFKDYRMEVEWRWKKVLACSGVLLHIQIIVKTNYLKYLVLKKEPIN